MVADRSAAIFLPSPCWFDASKADNFKVWNIHKVRISKINERDVLEKGQKNIWTKNDWNIFQSDESNKPKHLGKKKKEQTTSTQNIKKTTGSHVTIKLLQCSDKILKRAREKDVLHREE